MVPLGDIDVHVAEAGDGPPLLLLHGWPQHWYVWRHLVPRLSGEFRLIMPDLRGFGWTTATPRGYEKEQLVDDLLRLLDALGLDQVDLVGHDWGGWVGFLACLRAPQRFRRYVALNIAHPWPTVSAENTRSLFNFWYQVVLASPKLGSAIIRRSSFVEKVIKGGAHQRIEDAAIRHFADHLRDPARARASVQLYRRFLLTELGPVIAGRYDKQRLTVPTRVVMGTRDPAIRPGMLAGHEEHADHFEIVLTDDSGHFIAEELPDLVAENIREFCSRG
jgi:pimeloyl-ACP methyl ester carboxylesterase